MSKTLNLLITGFHELQYLPAKITTNFEDFQDLLLKITTQRNESQHFPTKNATPLYIFSYLSKE